jgi:hypothetical protein
MTRERPLVCWNLRRTGGDPMSAFLEPISTAYKFLFLLHIVSVVYGIGTVVLNGLYAQQAQSRPGPSGRAIIEANFFVTNVAEYVIYTVPVWGILLVLASHDNFKFSQTWVWLALLLYIAAIGISHAVMFPGVKRIIALQKETEQQQPSAGGAPPQVAEMQAVGRRVATGGMVLNLLVVVILVLMIWKPGF